MQQNETNEYMSYSVDLPFVRLHSNKPPEVRRQLSLSFRRQVGSNASVSGINVDFQNGGMHSRVGLSSEHDSGWLEVQRNAKTAAEFRRAAYCAIANTLHSVQVAEEEIQRLLAATQTVLSRGKFGNSNVPNRLPMADIHRAFDEAGLSTRTIQKCQFRVVSTSGVHAGANVGLRLEDESGYRMSGTSASINLVIQQGAGFMVGAKPGSIKFVSETSHVQLEVRLFDAQAQALTGAQLVSPLLEEIDDTSNVWWTKEHEDEVGGYESDNDLE